MPPFCVCSVPPVLPPKLCPPRVVCVCCVCFWDFKGPSEGLARLETFFARTAWSQTKIQNLARNCAKFVHAHSRKPHPNILRKLCKCTPAQISHNLNTFSDAPAHLSHKFSGSPVENAPRTSFTQFSRTHGLFSESASVRAMNVSMLGFPCFTR